MSAHTTPCKICHRPVTVEFSDGYEELGDYLKLLPMATHNSCYDLRDRRVKITDSLFKACCNLIQMGAKDKKESSETYKSILRVLTQKYAAWWRDAEGQSAVIWDNELVDMIWDRPGDWTKILDNYRRHARMIWGAKP